MANITVSKKYGDDYKMAQSYFRVILGVLGQDLTPKELEILSFIAVRGNILTTKARYDFKDLYGTTQSTINNTLVRLKKRKLLVKREGKIFINPELFSKMEDTMTINITLNAGRKED